MPFCLNYPCGNVLCANYGCMKPKAPIPSYDPKSSAERQREWNEEVLKLNWLDP